MGGGELVTPKLENLPFRRAETVTQCISAGQLTGPRKRSQASSFAGQPLTPLALGSKILIEGKG